MTTHKCLPEGATHRRLFHQMTGGDAKLKLYWMQDLPAAKAALRTPVMKEPCLFVCKFVRSIYKNLTPRPGPRLQVQEQDRGIQHQDQEQGCKS